jgi:hypothetical protein
MGGGSGGGGGETIIRYAPYIEDHHAVFLQESYDKGEAVLNNNPYDNFTDVDVDSGFFGTGYVLASFPGLYDIFGKFMAGLDIEALWNEIYNSTLNSAAVSDLISAQSTSLSDQMTQDQLPKFQLGLRDMNAVMTSSYVIGKALLLDQQTKELNKFAKELRFRMIDTAQDRWKTHLQWNMNVASNYANMVKTYFGVKHAMTQLNYEIAAKNAIWPMTVLDYEKANLGALQGATSTKTSESGQSSGMQLLGGAIAVIGLAAMFA